MKNFDIKRFARTMVWNLNASRREYLANMVSMFFVFLLFFCISIMDHRFSPEDIRLNVLNKAVQLSITVMVIFVMICGCWIFSNMKTKQQRIMYKMLPASYLEKFLVRYLYIFILWTVGIFVAFCLADVTRILICEIAGIDWIESSVPLLFHHLVEAEVVNIGNVEMPSVVVLGNVWLLWMHSTYVLGGTFFRRRQFVFTSLVHFVLGMLLLWLISGLSDNVDKESFALSLESVAYALSVLLVALTVFNYWLSFHLFKRMQVINNKWINI